MYIKREDALKSICEYCSEKGMCADANVHCTEFADIKAIPAADVVPAKRGRWKLDSNNCLVCSECGNPAEINGITGEFMESPYCSECGAKMA